MNGAALAEALNDVCRQMSEWAQAAGHDDLPSVEAALRPLVDGPPFEEAAAVLRTAEVLIDEHVLQAAPHELEDPVTDFAEQLLEIYAQSCVMFCAHDEGAFERDGGGRPELFYVRMRRQLEAALTELEAAWPPEALEEACARLREIEAALTEGDHRPRRTW